VTIGQIDSALTSKSEQMKLNEQKREEDIEAARLVPPSSQSIPCVADVGTLQVLQTSADNTEIAQAFVTLLRYWRRWW
jgi:hypothetical protein